MTIWYSPQLMAALKLIFFFVVLPAYTALFAYSLGLIFGWVEAKDYKKKQEERLAKKKRRFWEDQDL